MKHLFLALVMIMGDIDMAFGQQADNTTPPAQQQTDDGQTAPSGESKADLGPKLSETLNSSCKSVDQQAIQQRYLTADGGSLSDGGDEAGARIWRLETLQSDLKAGAQSGGQNMPLPAACIDGLYKTGLQEQSDFWNREKLQQGCGDKPTEKWAIGEEEQGCGWVQHNLEYLAEFHNGFIKDMNHIADKANQAGGTTDCHGECTPAITDPVKTLHDVAMSAEDAACCQVFRDRDQDWIVKVSDQDCQDLHHGKNGDNSSAMECAKKALRGIYDGIRSQLSIIKDIATLSFFSGIASLVAELFTHPVEAVKHFFIGIGKSLGIDMDYYSCLDESQKMPYMCSVLSNVATQAAMLAWAWPALFKVMRYGAAALDGAQAAKLRGLFKAAKKVVGEKTPEFVKKIPDSKVVKGTVEFGAKVVRFVKNLKSMTYKIITDRIPFRLKARATAIANRLSEIRENRAVSSLTKKIEKLEDAYKKNPNDDLKVEIETKKAELDAKVANVSEVQKLRAELATDKAELHSLQKQKLGTLSVKAQEDVLAKIEALQKNIAGNSGKLASLTGKASTVADATNSTANNQGGANNGAGSSAATAQKIDELKAKQAAQQAQYDQNLANYKAQYPDGSPRTGISDRLKQDLKNQKAKIARTQKAIAKLENDVTPAPATAAASTSVEVDVAKAKVKGIEARAKNIENDIKLENSKTFPNPNTIKQLTDELTSVQSDLTEANANLKTLKAQRPSLAQRIKSRFAKDPQATSPNTNVTNDAKAGNTASQAPSSASTAKLDALKAKQAAQQAQYDQNLANYKAQYPDGSPRTGISDRLKQDLKNQKAKITRTQKAIAKLENDVTPAPAAPDKFSRREYNKARMERDDLVKKIAKAERKARGPLPDDNPDVVRVAELNSNIERMDQLRGGGAAPNTNAPTYPSSTDINIEKAKIKGIEARVKNLEKDIDLEKQKVNSNPNTVQQLTDELTSANADLTNANTGLKTMKTQRPGIIQRTRDRFADQPDASGVARPTGADIDLVNAKIKGIKARIANLQKDIDLENHKTFPNPNTVQQLTDQATAAKGDLTNANASLKAMKAQRASAGQRTKSALKSVPKKTKQFVIDNPTTPLTGVRALDEGGKERERTTRQPNEAPPAN